MKYIDTDTMTTQAKYNERKLGLEWVADYRIYPQQGYYIEYKPSYR